MDQAARILVVDDEANIRFFLEETLSRENYQVTTAENGEEALGLIEHEEFDLALIDLHMPGEGGISLLSAMHKRWPDTIVIVLTAYASIETAVEALREGAHDYLFKPCKTEEIRTSVRNGLVKRQQNMQKRSLLAHLEHQLNNNLEEIRAAINGQPGDNPAQKAAPAPQPERPVKDEHCLYWNDLVVDLNRHTVNLKGQFLELSPTEFGLLACLVVEAPKVVSPQRLVREVQGYESQPWEASEIVRYHIYRIRLKAKKITGRDDLIRTVRGIGYTLAE